MNRFKKLFNVFLIIFLGITLVSLGSSEVRAEENWDFHETFDNAKIEGSYTDGNFTGIEGVEWKYVEARDQDIYPIDEKGIMLRRADEPSSLEATFLNGIGQFSFDHRKAFSGNADRKYSVDITNND